MQTCFQDKKTGYHLKGFAKRQLHYAFFFLFVSKVTKHQHHLLSFYDPFSEIRSFNNLGGRPWLTQLRTLSFKFTIFTSSIYIIYICRVGGTLIIHPHSFSLFLHLRHTSRSRRQWKLWWNEKSLGSWLAPRHLGRLRSRWRDCCLLRLVTSLPTNPGRQNNVKLLFSFPLLL